MAAQILKGHGHMKRKSVAEIHDEFVEHFQQRCMERVGYILTQRFLKEEMRSGRLRILNRQPNARTKYILRRKFGRDLVVVYDQRFQVFVTVMYLDEMDGRNGFRWS